MSGLRADDLDYDLPDALIARTPVEPRDRARLLIADGALVRHAHVRDLPDVVRAGDLFVFNDTAVLPARVIGRKRPGGARVEGLFLDTDDDGTWRMMLRANKPLKDGTVIDLVSSDDAHAVAIEIIGRDGPLARVRPHADGAPATLLRAVGRTPIPPYILRAREVAAEAIGDDVDRAWYQTMFARDDAARSVAAPTAGLHFTPAVLDALHARGATTARVTLHVGAGTFKPIDVEYVDDHPMHTEWFEVPPATLEAIARTRAAGGRVIAVGTTTVRTLESLPAVLPDPGAGAVGGATALLIRPPYAFRHVDAMVTNFHLPRSTLIALVAAMTGLDELKALYADAIERGYRFYSYGDAMFVTPRGAGLS